MRIKLFRATSMTAAMSLVRSEMGPDALILSSRRVAEGIELTAALEDECAPAAPLDAATPHSNDAGSRDDASAMFGRGAREEICRNQPFAGAQDLPPLQQRIDLEPPRRLSPWQPPRMAASDRHASVTRDDRPREASAGGRWPREDWPCEDLPRAPRRDERRAECLAWHGVTESVARRLTDAHLPSALARAYRFLPVVPHGDAPTLLVSGPPGAGKTLTIARLATRMVLAGQRPIVVTADGQRAGAAEQLAAFTRLLGLELLVARGPAALAHAVGRRDAGVPVLIDSPGIDAIERLGSGEIPALRDASGARLALVLPSGLDASEAEETGAAFAGLGADLLIANRLDVSRRLGGVLAAASAGLAFSEAGIGPGAADGLVPMTPDLLAERLLTCPDRPS